MKKLVEKLPICLTRLGYARGTCSALSFKILDGNHCPTKNCLLLMVSRWKFWSQTGRVGSVHRSLKFIHHFLPDNAQFLV